MFQGEHEELARGDAELSVLQRLLLVLPLAHLPRDRPFHRPLPGLDPFYLQKARPLLKLEVILNFYKNNVAFWFSNCLN